MTYRFHGRIKPRPLSTEQRELVIEHYLLGSVPAWDVARLLGPEWGQSDIYWLAKKLADELGIDRPNRLRHQIRLDWPLVQEFRNEGASWDDIAAFYGTKGGGEAVKQNFLRRKNRGDFSHA